MKELAKDLEQAIRNNDAETVRRLIAAGAPLDEVIYNRYKPLHLAAMLRKPEIVRLLLELGADPDQGDYFGDTALAYTNDTKIAALLLEAGADINDQGADGCGPAPLHGAATSGRTKIMKFLLEHGADPNITEKTEFAEGQTPLMIAARDVKPKAIEMLLQYGADPDRQDRNGSTALMIAVMGRKKGYLQMVEALLAGGADPNIMRPDGMTALRYAVKYGSVDIVKALLDAGAEVNAKSQYHETALTGAIYGVPRTNTDIVQVLLDAGADPTVCISEGHPDPWRRGKTPRDLAVAEHKRPVVELLDEAIARWQESH